MKKSFFAVIGAAGLLTGCVQPQQPCVIMRAYPPGYHGPRQFMPTNGINYGSSYAPGPYTNGGYYSSDGGVYQGRPFVPYGSSNNGGGRPQKPTWDAYHVIYNDYRYPEGCQSLSN